ncbi:MAG: ABC transporter permease [Dehalococcoidia bacterium]|nr:ABC transporter permease [Dehalococcoidia bacterium]
MASYLANRVLLFIPVLLAVSIFVFLVLRVIPGDVAVLRLTGTSGEGVVTPEALAEVRRQLGTDRPLGEQYLTWMASVVRLNGGASMRTGEPAFQIIALRLPVTLELAVISLLVALLISLPAGILSAVRQNTWMDYVVRVVSIGGLSMPTFWTAILLLLFFVYVLNWMPPLAYVSLAQDPGANMLQMVWPALILGYYMSAGVTRMTRSCMLEVLRQDYVRTAWSKGLSERLVVLRHVVRNGLLPVVTIVGVQFGHLLGGAIIMETIFALPGMGVNLIESIRERDYTMIQSIVLLLSVWFLVINLLVDVLYAWLDPRVRYS